MMWNLVWNLIFAALICLTAVSFDVANAINRDDLSTTTTPPPRITATTPDSRNGRHGIGISALYFYGINGEQSTAGYLQAHRTSDVEGVIRVDCQSYTHESCQFYIYHHMFRGPEPLHFGFESLKYPGYFLYWDGFTNNVFLRNFAGKDCELESITNIWWVIDVPSDYHCIVKTKKPCYAAIPPYVMFVDNEDMRGGCECSSTCQCSNGITPRLTSSRDLAIKNGAIYFNYLEY